MPHGFEIAAPAKLNLFLEVLGRRADGYHELETVTVPISLFDRVRFHADRSGALRVVCTVDPCLCQQGPPPPLDDEANVAWRALHALREEAGDLQLGGVLRIAKQIPWQGGLGGGSSDAAAALQLANQGWDLRHTLPQLAEIGSTVGSDIPCFFAAGPAVCRGRGERVTAVASQNAWWFVVVKPALGLSTATVFSQLAPVQDSRSVVPFLQWFVAGSPASARAHCFNRLRTIACELQPEINDLLQGVEQTHPLVAEMSGSGSACFGLYPNRAAAHRASRILAARWPQALVRCCQAYFPRSPAALVRTD